MDASKKQREPVAFKSLAELKRFIRPGVELKTVSHANHADMVGLTRVVTTVQTVGFYSKIKDQPEHPFSTCNHGKGFYTDFGKAGNYIFDGTTVKVKDTRKQDRGVIYELEFYDREQNMEETMMDRKMVNFIKEQYPPGTRIRLNSICDDRPRQRAHHAVRSLLSASGESRSDCAGGRHHRPLRQHRALHWPASPFRGARQRGTGESKGISAERLKGRK